MAEVLALYEGLLMMRPVLGTYVARAAAVRQVHGAEVAMAALAELPTEAVRQYQPYWVLRAHCSADLGRDPDPELREALRLTTDPAVRRHLEQRWAS